MGRSRWNAAIAALVLVLQGCTFTQGDAAEVSNLPEPDVVMEADPPPPFTYWAPEGSTIINHSRSGSTWIAEKDGRPVAYYFGDMCKASTFQRFIGQQLSDFPQPAADAEWRFACTDCAVQSDLNFNRMTISFDEETNIVRSAACG
jgi:hypothetical protein